MDFTKTLSKGESSNSKNKRNDYKLSTQRGDAKTEKSRASEKFEQRKVERHKNNDKNDSGVSEKEKNNETSNSTKQTDNKKEGDSKNKAASTVEKLTKVLGRGKLAVARSEALALVSGQMQTLNPKEIPSIVAENPFVANAISADPAEFLQTKMTIKDIMDQLEIDEEVVIAAKNFGVDLGEMVSPKDFLKVLGIDPHQVTAQIARIKADLPKNGLANLMIDSGQGLKANMKKDPILNPGVDAASVRTKLRNSVQPENTPNPLSKKINEIQVSSSQKTLGTAGVSQNTENEVTNKEISEVIARINTAPAELNSKEGLTDTDKYDAKLHSDLASCNMEALTSTVDTGDSAEDLDNLTPNKNVKAGFNIENTDIDPYEKMGQMLKFRKVVDTSESEQNMNLRNLSKMVDSVDELQRLKHQKGTLLGNSLKIKGEQLDETTGLTESTIANVLDSSSNFSTKDLPMNSNLSPVLKNGLDDENNNNLEEDFAVDSSEIDKQLTPEGPDENFSLRSQNDRNWKSEANSISSTFSSNEVSDNRTVSDRVKIAENVIDKARLLLTKGGGSMAFQMNMSNNEILNIAVKLSGDQLSLRLSGENTQTIDRLASELSGLESSLRAQNIQLTGIELGTGVEADVNQQQANTGAEEQQQRDSQPGREDNLVDSILNNLTGPLEDTENKTLASIDAVKNGVVDSLSNISSNSKISIAV